MWTFCAGFLLRRDTRSACLAAVTGLLHAVHIDARMYNRHPGTSNKLNPHVHTFDSDVYVVLTLQVEVGFMIHFSTCVTWVTWPARERRVNNASEFSIFVWYVVLLTMINRYLETREFLTVYPPRSRSKYMKHSSCEAGVFSQYFLHHSTIVTSQRSRGKESYSFSHKYAYKYVMN